MNATPVLCVGPSWVGDMIMADACFQWLAARNCAVDVLAPAWSLPVLARMQSVRQAIALPVAHGEFGWSKRRGVAASLKKNAYQQAIVLPRSFKAALVPAFAGIPQRTGFRGELRYGLINDCRDFDKQRLDQTVKRFLYLALEAGESLPEKMPRPRLTVDAERASELRKELELGDSGSTVALMPGAEYGPAKCWPIERYAELALHLGDQGHAVWVFGSAKDQAAGDLICANSEARNLCGKTSLQDAIDLLAVCNVAVSNDSGLMHMAAAVGCHVVALYGSTTPVFTPPLTERATLVEREVDCRPCFKRECPMQHFACMRNISVEDIEQVLQPLLVSNN